jgi:predicted dehydrogenase
MKIGLISAATYGPRYADKNAPRTPGSYHGTAFASAFNGCDVEKAKKWEWTFEAAPRFFSDTQVTKVWDPQPEWAERLAEVCSIPNVTGTPEECCSEVDAVVIVDDGSGEQWKYARLPLQAGIPTFCDKPLAMTARQASEIAQLARKTGTPFMSASSLRFVPDLMALKQQHRELGDIHLAMSVCGNDLVYYGIHALSMYYGVFGGGDAVSCLNAGQAGRNLVRVRFRERDLVLLVAQAPYMRPGYQIDLFGTKGWKTLTPDLTNLYCYLLEQFVNMVKSGKEPYPLEEEVEVIAVLEAGERSLAEGREVTVAEVLEAV